MTSAFFVNGAPLNAPSLNNPQPVQISWSISPNYQLVPSTASGTPVQGCQLITIDTTVTVNNNNIWTLEYVDTTIKSSLT